MSEISQMAKALEWEGQYNYNIDGQYVVPKEITYHFATARTKDWPARVDDYFHSLAMRDSYEDRSDRSWDRIRRASSHHQSGGDDTQSHTIRRGSDDLDWSDEYYFACIPDESLYSTDNSQAVKDLVAWKHRRAIALFREKRIGTEFHGFMHLPPEIRNMIYGQILSGGTVVVPNDITRGHKQYYVQYPGDVHDELYQRYRGIEGATKRGLNKEIGRKSVNRVGLISGVSRKVQAEATRVFCGGNHFIFPAGIWIDFPAFTDHYANWHVKKYPEDASPFRDVSLTFDMRDVLISDYQNRYQQHASIAADDGDISSPDFLRRLHRSKEELLEIQWVERIDVLKIAALRRLQLSFEECYCGMGCCRKAVWVCDQLLYAGEPLGEAVTSPYGWAINPPRVIEIFGWANEREKRMIREKLEGLRNILKTIEIRFIGKSKAEQLASLDLLA